MIVCHQSARDAAPCDDDHDASVTTITMPGGIGPPLVVARLRSWPTPIRMRPAHGVRGYAGKVARR